MRYLLAGRQSGPAGTCYTELSNEGTIGLTKEEGRTNGCLDARARPRRVARIRARDTDARLQGLSLDELIRQRDHGVSPAYLREQNELGYKGLTVDDLVGLRNHGVSPERIRTANERAGTPLTIDALKSAAANGWR